MLRALTVRTGTNVPLALSCCLPCHAFDILRASVARANANDQSELIEALSRTLAR